MLKKPLVAIVDDDKSLRDATDNLLQAEGFATATFPDAESFLESPHRRGMACVVADMRMPGITGLDMYRELVARGERIPAVLMTAYPQDADRANARAAGIACCLAKPFAADELVACVRKAITEGHA